MTDPRHTTGQRGEDLVAARLEQAGYAILARNWRHPELGELDIVAQHGETLVFVEVRTRRGTLAQAVERALASVDDHKQARLAALAQAYITEHALEHLAARVTVAAVAIQGSTHAIEVIKDAIEW